MTIDPVAAALDALAGHLETALAGVATVLRGWPEADVRLDLGARPAVAVAAVASTTTRCAPGLVDQGAGTATWRVGYVDLRVEVGLWCAYRVTRDDTAPLIEAALHNRLPHDSGLVLESSGYHGRRVSGEVVDSRTEDDAGRGHRGEWRQTWTLRCSTDLVVVAEQVAVAELATELRTEHHGETETISF